MQDFFKRSGEFGEGALTIIGVGVSPIAIAELIPLAWANFTVTTEGAEYKAAVNFGSQMIQTNGDIRDVNIIELGLSTFQVGIPQLF